MISQRRNLFSQQIRDRQRKLIIEKRRKELHQLDSLHFQALRDSVVFPFEKDLFSLNLQFLETIVGPSLENIIEALVKWISSIPEMVKQLRNSTCEYIHSILNIAIPLCQYCLKEQIQLLAITSCLVQLTGLPKQVLQQIKVSEELLSNLFIKSCSEIIKSNNNLEIIQNCVYICGNLLVPYYQQNTISFTIENIVLDKLQLICGSELRNESCFETTLWFISIFLYVYERKKKIYSHNKQNCQQFAGRSIRICLGIAEYLWKENNVIMNSKILKLNENVFKNISSLLMVIECQKFENLQIFLLLDSAIIKFLVRFSDAQSDKKLLKTFFYISECLQQVLDKLKNMNVKSLQSHQGFSEVLRLACEGTIRCPEALKLCSSIIDLYFKFEWAKTISYQILHTTLFNVSNIFSCEEIVENREYRVQALRLFGQLEYYFCSGDIRETVFKFGKFDLMQQQNLKKPLSEHQKKQNRYQSFMIENVIVPILNILELMLIDESTQNRAIGLQIILKFTINWELSTNRVRNRIISMNTYILICKMQEQAEEMVYNRATDLIQQLSLDDIAG